MEKTISYLNSKTRYRLLKVVFGFLILISILIINVVIINNGTERLDNNKTLVYCTIGVDKKVLKPSDIGVTFSNNELKNFDYKSYLEGWNNFTINKILNECYGINTDKQSVLEIQKIYENPFWFQLALQDYSKTINDLSSKDMQYVNDHIVANGNDLQPGQLKINGGENNLNYSTKLFDIKPVYTYDEFIKLFVIGNILIFLFFEVIRRVFYYIALGSINPKK